MHLGGWDLALLLVISSQATAVAYLHQPRWKVLAMSLPFPFTLGSLSLGRPIDVTHMAGLALLPAFMHGVRVLRQVARVPIVAAIAVSAVSYCLVGAGLAHVLPRTAAAFWLAAGLAAAEAATFSVLTRRRDEPGHRSPLPLWIKLPAVGGVILSLILAKQALAGFMAMFPIMGAVTAYEARRSLWAVCRQVHAMVLAIAPMVMTVWLLQGRWGRGPALVAGWAVFLVILLPLAWKMWFTKSSGAQPT